MAVAAALCFVDVALALAALWAGVAQATAELFGFGGVGLRSGARAMRGLGRVARASVKELWRSVRMETREKFLED